jgi:hypothetical protein
VLLPKKFSEILALNGRDLRGIGINEVALLRKDALEAIQALKGHQIAVLGGDVYHEKDGKMRPTHYNWSCEKQKVENPVQFSDRSQRVALGFIKDYNLYPEAHTFYVLVVAGLGIVGPRTDR